MTKKLFQDTISRRAVFKNTALMAVGIAGAAVLDPAPAFAGTDVDIPASAKKKCATCRYWGGIRRISKDGQTVTAKGKGWCNNPESPVYQKLTKPTQGAPVWTKWDALG